jgi:hypothetical protein
MANGSDAGTQVGSLYYDLDVPTDKLDKSLEGSDKKVKDFGESSVKTGDAIKSGLNKAALGFTVVGAGLTLAAKNATDFTIGQVKDAKTLSRQIGTTVEDASRLQAAFSRTGISSEQAAAAFGIFSKNIVSSTKDVEKNKQAFDKLNLQIEGTKRDIADTTKEIKDHGDKSGDLNFKLKTLNQTLAQQQQSLKESTDGFAKLGVKTVDATGKQKDFKTLLFEVADKFKAMPNGIDKTALSMELFGRQGKDLLPALNLGSQGIQDLEKEADKLGLTLSSNTIAKITALVQSQKDLKQQTDALKISIGTATAPVLTEFNTRINDILQSLLATDSPMRGLTANVLAFGGPALSFTGAALGMAANLVTVAQGAEAAKLSVIGLQLAAIGGVALPVAGAIAGLGIIAATAYETKKAIDMVSESIEELSKKKVNVGNTGVKAGGTSGTGLVAQLRTFFGGYAEGTNFAPGGLKWVGERGPELMNVPHGAQVIPSDTSRSIVSGQGGSQTVQHSVDLRGSVFRDQSDVRYMVDLLGRNTELAAQGMPALRGA